ncbi:GNAT family N-acetyltransferase [Nakamurella flava]|nr:GNAT family N-acetyltransferase [Nakamurella flava]
MTRHRSEAAGFQPAPVLHVEHAPHLDRLGRGDPRAHQSHLGLARRRSRRSNSLGFFRDPTAWFPLLSAQRHGWIAVTDDESVGLLDLQVDGPTGFFSYYIAPQFRRRGLGTALLLGLRMRCAELGVNRVLGYVEPTNTPSLATLRRAGFTVADHLDDEGMLEVSRALAEP